MASIWTGALLDATPDAVWQALRNVGELHHVLVPGFVVDAKMDGDARIVTFFNGLVIREPIVTIDEERRRLTWTAVGGATSHYNAAAQVFPEGPDRATFVWTVDLLRHANCFCQPAGSASQHTAAANLGATAVVPVAVADEAPCSRLDIATGSGIHCVFSS